MSQPEGKIPLFYQKTGLNTPARPKKSHAVLNINRNEVKDIQNNKEDQNLDIDGYKTSLHLSSFQGCRTDRRVGVSIQDGPLCRTLDGSSWSDTEIYKNISKQSKNITQMHCS